MAIFMGGGGGGVGGGGAYVLHSDKEGIFGDNKKDRCYLVMIQIDCWPDMPLLGNLADMPYLKDQSLLH